MPTRAQSPGPPESAAGSIPGIVTQALAAIGAGGDPRAADEFLRQVQNELRALARDTLAAEQGRWLVQTSSLVQRAFLRLFGKADFDFRNRAYFFGAAAEAMRRILVDEARKRRAIKHGGQHRIVNLEHSDVLDEKTELATVDIIALHEAVDRLAQHDERMAEVVKLRFFAGLDVGQIAQALDVARRTIERDWLSARAWLARELGFIDAANAGKAMSDDC